LVLALASLLPFGYVFTLGGTALAPFEDYDIHASIAAAMEASGQVDVPHPLYHWLVIATRAVVPHVDFALACLLVALAAQAAMVGVTFLALRAASPTGLALPAIGALLLSIVNPVNALTPSGREAYFGYFFPNVYHNPTVVLLRPLALGLFLAYTRATAENEGPPSRGLLAAVALLTTASTLAKPSHLICLLPAAALLWALARWRGQRGGTPALLACAVPGTLLLAAQSWFLTHSDRMDSTSIVFAPLWALSCHVRDGWPLLALKALLSVLFPAVVVVAYGAAARRDPTLRLGWLTLGVGMAYAYGLAETGRRLEDCNFLWGAQVSVAILFVASARFALARAASRARLWACGCALAAHAVSGALYIGRLVSTGQAFW
jgi:hypothetical protein